MITTQAVYVVLHKQQLCGVFSSRDKAEIFALRFLQKYQDYKISDISILDTFLDEPVQ